MIVGKRSPVACAICGIKGDLKENSGEITVTFPEEQKAIARLTLQGTKMHFDDVVETVGKNIAFMGDVQAKLKRDTSLKAVKPPKSA